MGRLTGMWAKALAMSVGVGLLAAGGAAAGPAAKASPAAVLTSSRGRVVVLHGPRSQVARAPCKPMAGDRLRLAPNAEAVLIYPDRRPERVSAGNQVREVAIPRPGGEAPAEGVMARLWRFLTVRMSGARVTAAGTSYAGRAGADEPTGFWPCDTDVLAARPSFAWRALPGARYKLTLLDDAATALWSSEVVAEPALVYADDVPPLEAGRRYWWQVYAISDDGVAVSGPYWLRLADPARAAAVEAALGKLKAEAGGDEAALATARGLLLAQRGFRGEALEALVNAPGGSAAADQAARDAAVRAWSRALGPEGGEE